MGLAAMATIARDRGSLSGAIGLR